MELILEIKDRIINFIEINRTLVFKILAVLIIGITVLTIVSSLKQKDEGNTSGNLNFNHGISALDGKWIYYIEFDDNEPASIYRVKKNGDKKEKVIEGYFEYINVLDGYIYCLEKVEDKNEYNLVKMKTNGNKKETLAKNVDRNVVTATRKKVFYYKDKNLYSIKTNGNDKEKISSKEIKYYQVLGNKIYYLYENENDGYIAMMKTNGENNTRIGRVKDGEYLSLMVKGNKIYYISAEKNDDNQIEYKLHRMNKKGEKIETIYTFNEKIETVNMQKDALYYVVKDEKYKIFKMSYTTGKRELIKMVEDFEAVGINDKWVFFVIEEDNELMTKRITKKGSKEQKL